MELPLLLIIFYATSRCNTAAQQRCPVQHTRAPVLQAQDSNNSANATNPTYSWQCNPNCMATITQAPYMQSLGCDKTTTIFPTNWLNNRRIKGVWKATNISIKNVWGDLISVVLSVSECLFSAVCCFVVVNTW